MNLLCINFQNTLMYNDHCIPFCKVTWQFEGM